MLYDRIRHRFLEQSYTFYYNVWFLIRKKDSKIRLINSVTKMNTVTIKDAFIPLGADEFAEDFAMYKVLSLLDFFLGYNQAPLDTKSQDIITFTIPIGLLYICILP
jgi:hypothetical protein